MKKILTIVVSILLIFVLVACGEKGANGKTPYIQDDYWYIDGVNTGVRAEGVDGTNGKDGINGLDGKDGINGTDGKDGANGADGRTPYIQDGYWYMDGTNTGVKAEGVDGTNGKDGQNGTNGTDGTNGLSAFEIFKKYNPEYAGTEAEWIHAVATNDVCFLFGHNTVIDKAVQATCTTEGLTEGSHCEICGKVFIEQKVIEANHSLVDSICSVCGFDCDTNGFELRLAEDGESYYVKSYNGTDLHPIIPSVYNGKPVTAIAEHAFNGLWSESSFITMEIPNSITSIGYSAFGYCSSLISIEIPESVVCLGRADAPVFFGCDSLERIEVHPNNPVYDSRNNCNAIIETATNTLVNGFNNTTIPDSVTKIGYCAFHSCKLLSTITIPQSVIYIDYGAFMECENLTSVYYTGTKKQWKDIEIDIGLNANKYLMNATLICTGTEDEDTKDGNNSFIYESNGDGTSSIVGMATIISIPSETPDGEAINRIASYTFSNLKNIIIEMPSTIQMIDDYAFDNCEIKEIRFSGTCEEWYNIVKNDGSWNYNSYGFDVICTDGTITY